MSSRDKIFALLNKSGIADRQHIFSCINAHNSYEGYAIMDRLVELEEIKVINYNSSEGGSIQVFSIH